MPFFKGRLKNGCQFGEGFRGVFDVVEAAERGRVEGEDVVFHKCAVAVFFVGVVELGKPLAEFGKVVRRQCAVHVFEQEVPSADCACGHGGEVGRGFGGGLPDGVDEA